MQKIIHVFHQENGKYRFMRRLIVFGLMLVATTLPRLLLAVGLDPVPVFASANVQVDVQRDSSNPFVEYVYTYTIGNPGTNTGEIWHVRIDISDPLERFDPPTNATLPRGTATIDFFQYRDRIQPLILPAGASVIPISQQVPPGWLGGFGRDGFLGFASGNGTPNILPGESLGGFQMTSRRVPTLRRIHVIPDWMFLVADHNETTDEDLEEAATVEASLRFTTTTLGPSTVIGQGSFEHWNKLRDDLNEMIDALQWMDPHSGLRCFSNCPRRAPHWMPEMGH